MSRTRTETGTGRPENRHDRVLAVVQENAASLLRLARRHSLCADDAQDAYQRALEIYLRRVDDIEDATAGAWLRTVVKHEAMAVRESRQRIVSQDDVDLDTWPSPHRDGEEHALSFERIERAAEALQHCKADQVSAIVLKAEGHSYAEISSITGWSYTKVNRCLAEGRARFLDKFAAIESGAECDRLGPLLSAIADGEATADEFDAVRPHLRNCPGCRGTLRELVDAQPAIRAVLPVTLLGTPVAGEAGVGALSRTWEVAFGGVQDRVLAAGMKVQAAVEAVSASKVAAVAASAAAVAGGGAVAVERAAHAPRPAVPRTQMVSETRERPAPRRPAHVVRATAATPTPIGTPEPRPKRTPEPRPARTPEPAPRTAAPAPAPPTQPEFGFEATAQAAAAPATPPPPGPARAPDRRGEQTESFGFER